MPYSPTVYVNGTTPAINATDLNKLKNELASQAAATSTAHSMQTWVNGAAPAVSDQTNLNEMERVAQAVATSLGLTYNTTLWNVGWTPPRNATNLNKLEIAARDNRAALDAQGAVPGIPTGLAATPGNQQIQLNWNARPVGENVDFYQIYEGNPSADLDLNIVGTSKLVTTNHLGNTLVNGTPYEFRVSAHNAAGYSPWSDPSVISTPNGPAPPNNRFTNINFAEGQYGVLATDFVNDGGSVFECYAVDARLSDWGGLPPNYYDNPGAYGYSPPTSMTTDPNQRVHLFNPTSVGLPANPGGGSWASWQELRTSDPRWCNNSPNCTGLAKSTLNVSHGHTMGPGGWSFGAVRWYAWDILFPLNINHGGGVASFEQPNYELSLCFLHDSGDTGGTPIQVRSFPGYPIDLYYSTTPNQDSGGVPYIDVVLTRLWDASGNRVTNQFNVWHEIVVGTKLSADNSGWFEVWFNGVQKAPQTARQMVAAAEGGPYLQLQNYTSHPTTYVSGASRGVVVYGGVRAGLARTDVQTR